MILSFSLFLSVCLTLLLLSCSLSLSILMLFSALCSVWLALGFVSDTAPLRHSRRRGYQAESPCTASSNYPRQPLPVQGFPWPSLPASHCAAYQPLLSTHVRHNSRRLPSMTTFAKLTASNVLTERM